MADPFSWAAIGASALSAVAGGLAESGQEKANAAVADANAVETGRALASEDAAAQRQQSAMVGDSIAATGANGLTLSGSPLDVTLQNLYESEFNRLSQRRQRVGEMEGFKYEAAAARARGKQAMIGGALSAAGSLAGGASDLLAPASKASSEAGWGKVRSTMMKRR